MVWKTKSKYLKIRMFALSGIDEEEDWYFSVVDVCWILADSPDYTTARKY